MSGELRAKCTYFVCPVEKGAIMENNNRVSGFNVIPRRGAFGNQPNSAQIANANGKKEPKTKKTKKVK